MRSRDRILGNLDTIYRESYDRAKKSADERRMVELDWAYMRDQLMLEILLDIRDLFSVARVRPLDVVRELRRGHGAGKARSHSPAH